MMKHIILFGIQGSGKGTQAKNIVTQYPAYKHLEMWDIFRGLKGMDNYLWDYFKLIDRGTYLSDSVVTAVFDIFQSIVNKGEYMIIDGFPRTMGQMYMFMDRMRKAKMERQALLFDLPLEEAIKRLSNRKFYRKDGYVYHIRNDEDLLYAQQNGFEIFHRDDDQPDAIKKRFDQHIKNTVPMLDFLDEKWFLARVDASYAPEEVFESVKKIIENN